MVELPAAVKQRQAQQEAEDDAGRRAAAAALPGALADAFAPKPFIEVGKGEDGIAKFSVRPFCDADFEILQHLENPIQKMISHAFDGENVSDAEIEPIIKKLSRGQAAWDICFVLTTPADEVDELLKTAGVAGVKEAARKKFRTLPTAAIVQIVMACMEQFNKSWETMVGFGAPKKEGEGASSGSPP